VQNGVPTLRSRLAWAHDFDPDRSTAATFQALPGARRKQWVPIRNFSLPLGGGARD
jgi:hypothetical protein